MSTPALGAANPFRAIKGEMAERVREFDWTATPLGAIAQWPQSLKTAVSVVLQSPISAVVLWGDDGIMIYNDGYSKFAGNRHPALLGSKIRDGRAEIADFNDNVLKTGLAGGTLAYRDHALNLNRNGTVEPVWIDFDSAPILGDDGEPAGVMAFVVETTERKRAEEALRRSQEKLRLATENAGVGLWDIDPEGGIDFFYSRDHSSFVMAQNERVPMEHLLEHLHPEDATRLRAAYDAARDPQTRAMLNLEYRVLPADDLPLRWIKVRGRGVFDGNGNCLRISGTSLDVTREREIQEALKQREEQFRLATENAGIGTWDMDFVNHRNQSDPRVKTMFAIPPDEDPPPEDFFALIHRDDIARVESAFAAASDPAKRAIYDVEYRVIGRDDGIQRWIHAKGRGLFDEKGQCLRITGTAMDVTARREIGEARRRSEEQLRLATEHAEIGMWDVDNIKGTLHWTREVRAAFGISHDNPVTLERDFYASLHPDDRDATARAYLAANDPQTRALYDVEYRTIGQQDGVVRWVHAKGRGVFDEQGRCVRVIGTTMDISPRKEIERQLHELNETLEKRVAERTAALEKSRAALQQAQKMEAIGNLTGGIAHDFNNLLQGLTGSLDLIRKKPEDAARVRRWAEAGLESAERGAKLTAQLLAFSRAQKLEIKPLDLPALLNGMRELLGRTLGPSIEVALDLSPDVPAALGDEIQLEMAVLNLAINARDAMEGGGRLCISTRAERIEDPGELAPGDYAALTVTDTGIGMPPEVAARAFDPFFTTKDVGKGTGLGLSQVYGMARQAGGTAHIRSAPGEGTSVCILLRATQADVAQDRRMAAQDANQALAPATILVVDDDPGVRRFLRESLDTFGYAVVTAKDGESGLEILQRMRPDLLIVDYAMPGMTGAELAKQARIHHPNLSIVFASGYAVTAALENALDGKAFMLRKPFRLDELQAMIAKALR